MMREDRATPRVSSALAPLLDDPRSVIWPPREGQSLAAYRQRLDAPLAAMAGPAVEQVIDLPGGVGLVPPPVALRLYRPSLVAGLPVVLFLHGGGFVVGSLATHDGLCRSLAVATGAAVVAVDYRLAPETPYPGALEDCMGALRWLAGAAATLGLDASRVALCGDSAGGQLAIATCLAVQGSGIAPCHLGLIYPVIDPACGSASARTFAEGYLLSRRAMQWFWDCYAGGQATDEDPLLSVLTASLGSLPPTSILTAEFDPLRDEGEAFARLTEASGVAVAARRYLGMPHGFMSLGALTGMADRAMADLAGDLALSFGGTAAKQA